MTLIPYNDAQGRLCYNVYHSPKDLGSKKMKLVDLETGKEIPTIKNSKPTVYLFDMNGSYTHRFKWVKQTQEVNIFYTYSKNSTRGITKREIFSSKSLKTASSFDLAHPPKPRR